MTHRHSHTDAFHSKGRGERVLRALVFSVGLAATQTLAATAAATPSFTAYLFAYFTGNDKAQEAIRFALSDDGYTYKAINKGNAILSSSNISSTGGVRDPHILRGENNDYYMVATDMVSANGWNSNRGMALLKSNNLVDWTSSKVNIPTAFTQFAAADRVWAPQTIYDPSVGKYMVYFAMRLGGSDADKIYWAYANSAFTALETAPKVLYTYNNLPAIDGDIVLKDSIYHLFFKTEGNGNGIKSATSRKLTGPYTLIDKYVQPTTVAVEGSCAFKLINSTTWILMYDMYTSGQYQFAASTDLQNFTVAPKTPSFDFTPRHGTVIQITDAEKNALNAKWSPSSTLKAAAPTRLEYQFLSGSRKLAVRLEGASDLDVSLWNMEGRAILHRSISGDRGEVDASSLPRGIYDLRCRGTGAETSTVKVILP